MTTKQIVEELARRGVKPHKEGGPGVAGGQLEFLECQLDEVFPGGDCEHGTPRIHKCGKGCECKHGMPLIWGCRKCGTGKFA